MMSQTGSGRVVYCQQPLCTNGDHPPYPATVLLTTTDDSAWLPSCGSCAQWWHQKAAGLVQLAPLSEWVDEFAQQYRTVTGRAPAQRPLPAPVPPELAPDWQPEPVPAPAATVPLPAAPARYQPDPNIKWAWLAALGAFAIGIALIIPAQLQSVASGNLGTLRAFGVIFVVASVIGMIVTAAITIGSRLSAWHATLSPADRRKAELAETAALWATWGAVHYGLGAFNERTARNTATMRGHMASVEHLNDNLPSRSREQWNAPQAPASAPGPHRSDIYGNLI